MWYREKGSFNLDSPGLETDWLKFWLKAETISQNVCFATYFFGGGGEGGGDGRPELDREFSLDLFETFQWTETIRFKLLKIIF